MKKKKKQRWRQRWCLIHTWYEIVGRRECHVSISKSYFSPASTFLDIITVISLRFLLDISRQQLVRPHDCPVTIQLHVTYSETFAEIIGLFIKQHYVPARLHWFQCQPGLHGSAFTVAVWAAHLQALFRPSNVKSMQLSRSIAFSLAWILTHSCPCLAALIVRASLMLVLATIATSESWRTPYF